MQSMRISPIDCVFRQTLPADITVKSSFDVRHGIPNSIMEERKARVVGVAVLTSPRASSDSPIGPSANLGYFDPRWTSCAAPGRPAAKQNEAPNDRSGQS